MTQRRSPIWLSVVYSVLAVAAIGLIGLGIRDGDSGLQSIGIVSLFLVAASAPIAFIVRDSMRRMHDAGLHDQLRSVSDALHRLAEQQALSSDARRVLNRRGERDLLCRAIEEDITAEDWDAAMILVKELAEQFGYRREAEAFRAQIEAARYQTVERTVASGVQELDQLIIERRWDDATRHAQQLHRLYPDSPRSDGLRHRVELARSRYKSELERRFLHASKEDEVDEAMNLLRELDGYLTEQEAAPFKELAKGVIGKARENLGVQFKLAIQDRAWDRASSIGEQIMSEFPNSRMAEEVRGMIDEVRHRAAALTNNAG